MELECPSWARVLFNATLKEEALRNSGIELYTVEYKRIQILAYADDTVSVGRTACVQKEALINISKTEKEMGLNNQSEKLKRLQWMIRNLKGWKN
jgi:post-segregation antitoxin (ccd killing protein)